MRDLEFFGTRTLPTIDFRYKTGKLLIEGISIPENVSSFYGHIIDWIEDYCKSPNELTELDIKFKYYNTSTTKCISHIFRLIDTLYTEGNEVVVNWYYQKDDMDLKEAGMDFINLFRFPINVIAIKHL